MRKVILSLLTIVCAIVSWAIIEEREIMTILKNDGTTVVYEVNDIEKVSFEVQTDEYQLLITPAQGEALKMAAVPTVFRVSPANDGDPYLFGLTTVAATEPADARQGKYAIELSVSALKMNSSSVDLQGGATSGVTATLYTYADGEVSEVFDAQTSGTLTTSVNSKTKEVTIVLNATYKNGTTVYAEYKGAVKDVTSLEGFNPPYVYVNEGEYFNADGVPGGVFKVEGMTYTPGIENFRGVSGDRFDFTLSNGKTCWFILAHKYIDDVFEFATAEAGECYFWYDNIQLVSKGTPYMNQGTNGQIAVSMNEDRTLTINLKVSNLYISSYGSNGGTPEYVVLNYTSTDPLPEPEPQPEPIENLENQLQHYSNATTPDWPLTITKVDYSTEKAIPYNSSVKGDRFDIVFEEENAPTFYFIVDPELVGTTIDLATASPYYIKYGATELASPGLSWLSEKVGQEGTIQFTLQEDGSYIIDLDIKFKSSGNPNSQEFIKANCTTASIYVEPEPEPITVEPNTCLYIQSSGTERTFTVEECNVQAAKSYNGLTFDAYNLTLSGDMLCTVYIAADQYGNKIDFANAPDNSYFVTFGFSYSNLIQLGAKNTVRPGSYNEGKKGSLLVTKNENGTVVIDLDVTNDFTGGYGYNNGDGSQVVLNYTQPQPEPEPEPVVAPNPAPNFDFNSAAEPLKFIASTPATWNLPDNWVHNNILNGSLDATGGALVLSGGAPIVNNPNHYKTVNDNLRLIDLGGDCGKVWAINYTGSNLKDILQNQYQLDVDLPQTPLAGGWFVQNHVVLIPDPEVMKGYAGKKMRCRMELNIYKADELDNNALYAYYQSDQNDYNKADQSVASANRVKFGDFHTDGNWDPTKWMVYEFEFVVPGAPENLADWESAPRIKIETENNTGSCLMFRKIEIFNTEDVEGLEPINRAGKKFVTYTVNEPEPEPANTNQGEYYNADGALQGTFEVTGMTCTANVSYRGVSGDRFDFTLSNGKTCYFILAQKYIGSTFDFATAEAGECYFVYDNIQLASKGTQYMNQGTDGTIKVIKKDNGSYTVDLKVTNLYIPSWGGTGGSPEYVVLSYTGQ